MMYEPTWTNEGAGQVEHSSCHPTRSPHTSDCLVVFDLHLLFLLSYILCDAHGLFLQDVRRSHDVRRHNTHVFWRGPPLWRRYYRRRSHPPRGSRSGEVIIVNIAMLIQPSRCRYVGGGSGWCTRPDASSNSSSVPHSSHRGTS